MVVRMRHTRAHTANRRSHHALESMRFSKCPDCGAQHVRHQMCANCGKYRGKVIVDVLSGVKKRQERMKQKALSRGEEVKKTEDKK